MLRIFGFALIIAGLTLHGQDYDPSYGNLASAESSYDAADDYGDYVDDGQLIETAEAPPPLPEYYQPEIPGDDYYWTPGYWAWGPGGYYWVPGAWVLAPWVGAVWTPPYWGFESSLYRWHPGYWGQHVGFYGGIDYGFGYTGRGYYGAYWNGGHLRYNRAVTRVNVNIVRNVYNYSVPRRAVSRVSFNGGRGGINVRPTVQERAVVRDRRMPAVAAQAQHAREAANNRAQFAQGGRLRQNAQIASPRLNTDYRAPSAQPPAAARVAPQRQPGQRRPQLDNHLELQAPTPQVAPRPVPQQQPNNRPQPEQRMRQENRPAPAAQPAPQQQPNNRPQPQQRMRQENRPAPAAQPAPRAPQPNNHLELSRPAPQAAPQQAPPQPHDARPENRPAPQAQPAHPERGGGRR